jgi:RNA polymerase primary sigma factor
VLALALLGTTLTGGDPDHAASDVAALLARAKRGDRGAREEIVVRHMNLVSAIAHRYRGLGLPLDDLVQEGAIGLLAAIDRFEPGRGASFGTYAHLRIRNAVTRSLTEQGRTLRLPKSIVERRHALARAHERVGADGHRPTVEELAQASGLRDAEVIDALAAPDRVASLDAPLADGTTLEALVRDPAAADPEGCLLANERHSIVARAFCRLSPRQREVISRYYGLADRPESLVEIGTELHVSPERARAIRNDALHDLGLELEAVLSDRV